MNRLLELTGVFLKLGLVAFGGPAAHIALLESEFVARRIASGNAKVVPYYEAKKTVSKKEWQKLIQKVAPGFNVKNVGEGGVVLHKSFRNVTAVQTHPLDRKTASR